MSRAGIPVGHGLDRQQDNTITEQEAANIVSFFDKDGTTKPQHPHHHYLLTHRTYKPTSHPTFLPFQSRDRRRPAPVQRVYEYVTEHEDLVLTTKVLTQRGEGGKGSPAIAPGPGDPLMSVCDGCFGGWVDSR